MSARSELHRLLVKKLIKKYGDEASNIAGMQTHAANKLIQAEVDLFMHSHTKVQASDLAGLEGAVRQATQRRENCDDTHRYNSCASTTSSAGSRSSRPGTARSTRQQRRTCAIDYSPHNNNINADRLSRGSGSPRATIGFARTVGGSNSIADVSRRKQRPSTAGSATTSRRCGQRQQQKGGQRLAPTTTRSGRGKNGGDSWGDDDNIVPSNVKNEWLILEAYQQLKMDDKQSEDDRRAQEAIRRCREDLDKQVKQNQARAEREKEQEEARNEELRRQTAQHVSDQADLKEASRKKLLEEKCVRAAQILENERRREKERTEKKMDEDRVLAECKLKLREEKEAQLQKRKKIAASLRAMHLENQAKLAARQQQKTLDAEEDKRLAREYRERLDREQAKRATAHNERLQRYEMIGNQWTETGAGKRQHDIDVAEERRVLAEAAMKEKADEDREKRDKEALRMDRLRCLEDNKRLINERIVAKKAEEAEEAVYALKVRSEGENFVAEGVERKKLLAKERKAYARKLREQMRATRIAKATVQMTDTEREMNGALLRLLCMRTKNCRPKLAGGSSSTTRSAAEDIATVEGRQGAQPAE